MSERGMGLRNACRYPYPLPLSFTPAALAASSIFRAETGSPQMPTRRRSQRRYAASSRSSEACGNTAGRSSDQVGMSPARTTPAEVTRGRRAHQTCREFSAGSAVTTARSRRDSIPSSATGSQSSMRTRGFSLVKVLAFYQSSARRIRRARRAREASCPRHLEYQ